MSNAEDLAEKVVEAQAEAVIAQAKADTAKAEADVAQADARAEIETQSQAAEAVENLEEENAWLENRLAEMDQTHQNQINQLLESLSESQNRNQQETLSTLNQIAETFQLSNRTLLEKLESNLSAVVGAPKEAEIEPTVQVPEVRNKRRRI